MKPRALKKLSDAIVVKKRIDEARYETLRREHMDLISAAEELRHTKLDAMKNGIEEYDGASLKNNADYADARFALEKEKLSAAAYLAPALEAGRARFKNTLGKELGLEMLQREVKARKRKERNEQEERMLEQKRVKKR